MNKNCALKLVNEISLTSICFGNEELLACCNIVHSNKQSSLPHVTDCESLIRKMLVLDPSKRYSVEHIKRHRWMVAEAPRLLPSTGGEQHGAEPNEQILRLMQSLGIDAVKTREVSCHSELHAF